ncbi:putative hydrolase or acyltransferase of alpha/beta superfamily [Burkholderiales bacterium JOSHI_001]|nr:putative hydrolase or acyltransferase of alpha/beta superfamily [Burkholderiales bacterium JOSHI_001]
MQIHANGIAIEVDDRGPPGGPTLLLIMGLGMQLVAWPEELVDDLVRRGFRVLRMDNRDAGLSTGFDALGVPNIAWAGLKHALHISQQAPYSLADMAADALGVLDALGIAQAHVVGASMGGMIAQHLAVMQPQRVASLTLIMTTSGARHLPGPKGAVRAAMISRPRSNAPEDVVDHLSHLWGLIGSHTHPPEPQRFRERLLATVKRAWRPAGTARQLLAVIADGDRSGLLGRIACPTVIIHGQQDPLVPVAAAHDLATKIHGAELDVLEGMGHDLPLPLLPRMAAGIAGAVQRGRSDSFHDAAPIPHGSR